VERAVDWLYSSFHRAVGGGVYPVDGAVMRWRDSQVMQTGITRIPSTSVLSNAEWVVENSTY